MTVENASDAPLHEVRVVNFPGATPEQQGDNAGEPVTVWNVGTLAPGATATEEFQFFAETEGALNNCFAVEFTPTLCIETNVTAPSLRLVKEGPSEVVYCQPFTYTYRVTNTGTGVATDVQVSDDLPDGLSTVGGTGGDVDFVIDRIEPGQTRSYEVQVDATEPGTYASRARAGSGDLRVNSGEVETAVERAELALSVEGPQATYTDQPVDFRVVVRNTGDAASRPTTLRLDLTGAREAAGEREVPAIEPGEQQVYNVTTRSGGDGGEITLEAVALPFCQKGDEVRDQASVEVRTITSLQIEVVDAQDPVRIGDTTQYTIQVRNEGTADEPDVKLVGTMPEGFAYVSGQGASQITQQGETLDFAPILIPAGREATWTITVRADAAGSESAFRTELSSPSVERPIIEEEPTRAFDPENPEPAK